jgi:hypothetical protein
MVPSFFSVGSVVALYLNGAVQGCHESFYESCRRTHGKELFERALL